MDQRKLDLTDLIVDSFDTSAMVATSAGKTAIDIFCCTGCASGCGINPTAGGCASGGGDQTIAVLAVM
ncbi:MAG TPA: hypothetical protein VFE05_11785 [Longimicrobiaceae bacterium]|jgi:hypothetical protein|nr:hypothetical protein [Longimicrobiaceae bacterium]